MCIRDSCCTRTEVVICQVETAVTQVLGATSQVPPLLGRVGREGLDPKSKRPHKVPPFDARLGGLLHSVPHDGLSPTVSEQEGCSGGRWIVEIRLSRTSPYPRGDNERLAIQLFDEIRLSSVVLPCPGATPDVEVVAGSVATKGGEVDRGAVVGLSDRVAGHAFPGGRAALGPIGDIETGTM